MSHGTPHYDAVACPFMPADILLHRDMELWLAGATYPPAGSRTDGAMDRIIVLGDEHELLGLRGIA